LNAEKGRTSNAAYITKYIHAPHCEFVFIFDESWPIKFFVIVDQTMRIPLRRFLFILAALVLLPLHAAQAKRAAPEKVEPAIIGAVTYTAPNHDGRSPTVQATETATGKILWEQPVFSNFINPVLEEDVQWVFIKKLEPHGRDLMVTDESSRTYLLNTRTLEVSGMRKIEDFPVVGTLVMIACVALVFAVTRNWLRNMLGE